MNALDRIRLAYEEGCRHEDRRTHSGQVWFLEEPVIAAERAADEARKAVLAAERGAWRMAIRHVCYACRLEKAEYGHCRVWRSLYRAVRAACRLQAAGSSL